MATTIKEFIEYLKTLPPDTEVVSFVVILLATAMTRRRFHLRLMKIPVTQISPEIQM